MADVELLATRASDGLKALLARLASLAGGLAVAALVVSAATYATGLWATEGGTWTVVGAIICALPVLWAGLAWWRVKRTQAVAPAALDDLRAVIGDRQARGAMDVLIDHDTQQPIVSTVRTLSTIRADLEVRGTDWPALMQTLGAASTVPGLAALTVLGIVVVGGIGTILLLSGLL